MKYNTGCLKDSIDQRDWIIGDFIEVKAAELPPIVDHADVLTPVRSQGDEPSCVAFAACAMKEYQEKDGELSPRFLYSRIKQPQGGSYPRDAMKTLNNVGVPPEDCNPYVPQVPTPECPDAGGLASLNRIKGYARLVTIDEMRLSLFENGAFVAAFYVNDTWLNAGLDGVVHESSRIIGGHAILICGYDDVAQTFKFKNSWGGDWGDHGYGYISYKDAERSLMDAWSAVDVPDGEENNVTAKKWWQVLIELISNLFRR